VQTKRVSKSAICVLESAKVQDDYQNMQNLLQNQQKSCCGGHFGQIGSLFLRKFASDFM